MEKKVKIKLLPSSNAYKVLSITGETGDILKQHKVDIDALLLMKEGTITYEEATRKVNLSAGECLDIPANVFHEVTCEEDASFFVVLSTQAKMRFQK